ncbi:MAG: Rieske (2Fe-2S) protein [Planctomycetes bacterium]|nr:Rieske (2Fe-2S) protein [Planctomycetota bacterium]
MAKTASKSKDVAKITRREGLRKALFFGSWGVFVAFAGMLGVSIVRFVYPRIVWEPSSLFKIGKPDEYEVGSVTTMGERRVYIVRVKEGFYALSAVCTHLGCQPLWEEDNQIFMCPCHGGKFYKDGINFAGPPPKPLPKFFMMFAPDGRLMVDKSKEVGIDFILKV